MEKYLNAIVDVQYLIIQAIKQNENNEEIGKVLFQLEEDIQAIQKKRVEEYYGQY